MSLPDNAALLLVDVQRGMDEPRWGQRNNPDAERNIAALLAGWRRRGRPVIHVQHMSTEPDSPLRPERPGNAFKPEAVPQPGEPVFQKTVNSAFIGTQLEAHLGPVGSTPSSSPASRPIIACRRRRAWRRISGSRRS